ncbi:MAG: hypothetical protein OJF59_001976 [Cytophagales bacterium]|jgi:hypothetical protein|nr:hypothetical protein [Bacteroidota bacterium]MBS1980876.1 hypothetical protein [Bacteroidota bacterium]WHZ08223.1 MAG: hypothetical protein OJF59_001976 [Cytophagales bacterium]
MSYKPDDGTLMAYLYGELNDNEKEMLEKYFAQHPKEREKLKLLGDVRNIMSHAQDKEVIAPPVFAGTDNSRSLWQSGYFKISLGIAASILFLLMAGKILGPEISYSKGELRISFANKPAQKEKENLLNEEKIKELIASSLASNNETQKSIREGDQKKLMQTWVDMNSKKIDMLTQSASQASQKQVQSFVAGLQEQNLKLMKDYFQMNATEQKKYMENLLVDFSQYLQEQRKQDLQLVQSKMNYFEKNNSQFRQETEQILTSLISNPVKNKNNY